MLALLPKELTERYEPVDIIGYGAFAMVVKATDKRSGEMVAIKHIQTKMGDRQKFFRELNLTFRLKHPNLVRCIDVYCTNEQSSDIVLEFANKGTVREVILPNKSIDQSIAIQIIYQILLGLNFAHKEGIIHRDIKPENILVFQENDRIVYKISDFGVAKLLGPNQKAATSIGSPAYMAPEQFYDSYDFKTDVYGLGIVFYELLHGVTPFEGSAAEIFKGHLEKPLKFSPKCPEDLRQIISEMTLKTPGARPSTDQLLEKIISIAKNHGVSLVTVAVPAEESESHLSGASLFTELDEKVASTSVSASRQEAITDADIEEAKDEEESNVGQNSSDSIDESSDSAEEENALDNDFSDEVFDLFPQMDDSMASRASGNAPQMQQPKQEPPKHSTQHSTQKVSLPPSDVIKARSTSDFFVDGFSDDSKFSEPVVGDLKSVNSSNNFAYGRFKINKLWARTVDSKTAGLINLEDGGFVLLAMPAKGLQEIKPGGTRGKTIYEGKYDLLGQSLLGNISMVRDTTFCVLKRDEFYESDWNLTGSTDALALSHHLKYLATISGGSLTFRKWGGEEIWSGQFDRTGKGKFISFTSTADLMVCTYEGEDTALHFYSPDGEEVTIHDFKYPIISACRSIDSNGAWVIVEESDSAIQLMHANKEEMTPFCAIEKPLKNLVCSEEWICGVDDDGILYVVDLAIGLMAAIDDYDGDIMDIAVGGSSNELYILTKKSEVLRYVTAISIDISEPELELDLEDSETDETSQEQGESPQNNREEPTAKSFFSGGF